MWADSFTVGSNFFQNFVEKEVEAGTGKTGEGQVHWGRQIRRNVNKAKEQRRSSRNYRGRKTQTGTILAFRSKQRKQICLKSCSHYSSAEGSNAVERRSEEEEERKRKKGERQSRARGEEKERKKKEEERNRKEEDRKKKEEERKKRGRAEQEDRKSRGRGEKEGRKRRGRKAEGKKGDDEGEGWEKKRLRVNDRVNINRGWRRRLSPEVKEWVRKNK